MSKKVSKKTTQNQNDPSDTITLKVQLARFSQKGHDAEIIYDEEFNKINAVTFKQSFFKLQKNYSLTNQEAKP